MNKLIMAGLAAGALLSAQAGGVFVSTSSPVYSYSGFYPGFGYAYPTCVFPYYPTYPYVYGRPNYAVEGAFLGAWTGGLIGSTQCQGWQGAGIGAAAGLVLGGIAEAAARKHEESLVYAPPPPALQVASSQPPYRPPATYKPATPPKPLYQIPDAPRVPDAPTF